MKQALFALGLVAVFLSARPAVADTTVVVTNGTGTYRTGYLSFYDANGTFVVLDGGNGVVSLTYPDGTFSSFAYSQTVSGLSVTGTWDGTDESGYVYTASVQEYLMQTRHSGSGKGGGYRTFITTSLRDGQISYDYAGAYAPPLVAPVITATSTQTSVTLAWTSASGGIPPYSYSIFDQSGNDVADTTDLTSTISGLTAQTAYDYIIQTTDSAGRQIDSSPITVYTLAPTLDTVYTYNAADNSATATWDPDPTAVSYSVFYYDWALGMWIDGADTTGTSATVSGWSPDVSIPFYVAAYDANGIETDYDQQLVSVQPPPPPPPPGDSGEDGSDD
jgi:hypothetical protein